MRILFVMSTPVFARYYDTTIDALLDAGHEVIVGFTSVPPKPEMLETLEALETRRVSPRIIPELPERTDDLARIAAELRLFTDFARYLDPRFAQTQWLRDRRRQGVLKMRLLTRLIGRRDSLPGPLARALVRVLLSLEHAIESPKELERWLSDLGPDMLLVTPLVSGGRSQVDYVKSARALGIPSALCVASWDNLTNKGLMREIPDRVMVWNEVQRAEAVEMHGVPADSVVLTGAQVFDRWFDREPSMAREQFSEFVGLDPKKPYILYVGSTSGVAHPKAEDDFIRRWIRAIRASEDPELAGIGILVRFHPLRPSGWADVGLDEFSNAVVWPPERPNWSAEEARSEYFDSLFHSAAVVGINTSAMVEAATVGRPVFTIRAAEFRQAHEGTLHFAHLLPENGGFVDAAPDLDEHVRRLVATLRDPGPAVARNEEFVRAFIRPHGLDTPANDKLVSAIEGLAQVTPARRRPSLVAPLMRLVLRALVGTRTLRERLAEQNDPAAIRDKAKRVDALARSLAARLDRARLPGGKAVRAVGTSWLSRAHIRRSRVKSRRERMKQEQWEVKVRGRGDGGAQRGRDDRTGDPGSDTTLTHC